MASQSFIERFKNRSTKVTKWGNLNVESKHAVKQDITPSSPVQKSAKIILKSQQQSSSVVPVSISLQEKLDRLNFSVLSTQSSSYSPRQEYSPNIRSVHRSPQVNKHSSGIYAFHIKDSTFAPIPLMKSEDLPHRPTIQPIDGIRDKIEPTRNHSAKCTDFIPYTLEDYQLLNRNIELGGLGSSVIGSAEWKRRKETLDRRIQYGKYRMQSGESLNSSAKLDEVNHDSYGKYSRRFPQSVLY